ncbi:MAG: GDSL-type esterase/lipase family protein [Nanoarchaeota archaeon]|nr:hypothetical protein [Nanoarchaeota archaeon]MBU1030026.1 hypothetical protein [Nanoarchaeota archaeon]MBU1849964.1 hypothetical protein [Nanoarchaeota archaeon]
MRYLLFGASSTFGETDFENGGWAGHLRKHLDTKEKHCYFHNLAISGNTSRDILKRIESETRARLRNKSKEEWTIFISIGTNDSRLENKQPNVPEDEYQNNVKKILRIAKELAGTVIVISGHPVIETTCNPWKNRDCYFLNERIKTFGRIMKDCADKENILYLDIFSKLESRNNLNKLYSDGLHPNKEGHLVIFNEIKNFLEQELN